MSDCTFSDIVILAGGLGERLWPASTPEKPKQFLSLSNGISFLQSAVLRALSVAPSGRIVIVTRADLLEGVSAQAAALLPLLPKEKQKKITDDLLVVSEPCARHTCAPIALCCHTLNALEPDTEHSLLVLASDHIIETEEDFVSDCKKAYRCACEGAFVCFAIRPTEAATGYGYIKTGKALESDGSTFTIAQFKEKPDAATAQSYLESGTYWWNSGMFGFTAKFFMSELNRHAPDVAAAFSAFTSATPPVPGTINGIHCLAEWPPMQEAYRTVPAIAVDNAIAERTDRAVAVRASFRWDDVGSWDAFEKLFSEHPENMVEVQGRNNFVYSDIPVALCGVEDLVVVIKNGNALVMKKGTSAAMRDVVKKTKERF